MINNTAYSDVKAATVLISNAGIITTKQLDAFLTKRGLNKTRIDAVKKILIRENFAYTEPSNTYFSTSPMTNYTKFTDAINKAVWLFIDSVPTMNFANFKCKVPAIAYFCNDNYENISDIDDCTVFYVQKGNEAITSRIINTNFGNEKSTVKSIIIVDDEDQIDLIKLDEIINVVSFATVSNDGAVTYY